MELKYGLRLSPDSKIALVGSGGKTTALFQLAREYESAVLAAAAAHMAPEQLAYADRHYQIQDRSEIPAFRPEFQGQTLLFTGAPTASEERVQGLTQDVLEGLWIRAEEHQLPLLVEADGARRMPLKAPADLEPPIPPFVDTVIVVAGLSGLGRPLQEGVVHRPDLFGKIAGLLPGETIHMRHLERVLLSPQGSLKNIPPRARKILLLNQADAVNSLSGLDPLLRAVLDIYQAVGITSLGVKRRVYAVHEPLAGIVLAAGGSRRYGESKQLLLWHGEPFVRQAAKTALEAGLDPVIVVTGAEEQRVRKAVSDLDVRCVHNPDWERGQSRSVRTGVRALPAQVGGAAFLLADQPQIPAALVSRLMTAHAQSHAPIIVTRVDDQRANPVLFDRALFQDLKSLEGDVGGRALFDRYKLVYVPWEDPQIKFDVDTPEDYQRLINRNIEG